MGIAESTLRDAKSCFFLGSQVIIFSINPVPRSLCARSQDKAFVAGSEMRGDEANKFIYSAWMMTTPTKLLEKARDNAAAALERLKSDKETQSVPLHLSDAEADRLKKFMADLDYNAAHVHTGNPPMNLGQLSAVKEFCEGEIAKAEAGTRNKLRVASLIDADCESRREKVMRSGMAENMSMQEALKCADWLDELTLGVDVSGVMYNAETKM